MSPTQNGNVSFLPTEKFPEWANDERMNSLFAPLRKGSSNDQDYKSKINFWSRAIAEYLRYKQSCSFSIFELEQAFERKHAKPRCLSVVIEALLGSSEILPEDVFMRTSSDSWGSWAVNVFVKSPSSWLFSHLKSYITERNISSDEKFIHLQSIKILANFLLDHIKADFENKPITLTDFVHIFKENGNDLDEVTARQVLAYLHKIHKAKFYPQDATKPPVLLKVSRHSADDIVQRELTIESLRAKEKFLTREVKELEEKRVQVLVEIKTNLNKNRRQVAKTLLRKKKEIERIIEVRSNALVSIETMMMRISDAEMNAEMIEGYSMATGVLKNFRKDVTEDKVIDAQDELREQLDQNNLMEEVISEPIGNVITDAELEAELAELLETQEEEKLNDMGLPDLSQLNLKDLPSESVTSPQQRTTLSNSPGAL